MSATLKVAHRVEPLGDRFYQISTVRDLLGDWTVTVLWGRKGAKRRQRTSICGSDRRALLIAKALRLEFDARGYAEWGHSPPTASRRAATGKHQSGLALETRQQIDELHRSLLAYCMLRDGTGVPTSTDKLQTDNLLQLYAQSVLYEVARAIAELLSPGKSVGAMHRRNVLFQCLTMVGDVKQNNLAVTDNKVTYFIPRTFEPYLRYSIRSFLSKVERSAEIIDTLTRAGINRVADLVQYPPKELERLLQDAQAQAILKTEVRGAGLAFGVRAGTLKRPV